MAGGRASPCPTTWRPARRPALPTGALSPTADPRIPSPRAEVSSFACSPVRFVRLQILLLRHAHEDVVPVAAVPVEVLLERAAFDEAEALVQRFRLTVELTDPEIHHVHVEVEEQILQQHSVARTPISSATQRRDDVEPDLTVSVEGVDVLDPDDTDDRVFAELNDREALGRPRPRQALPPLRLLLARDHLDVAELQQRRHFVVELLECIEVACFDGSKPEVAVDVHASRSRDAR